MGLPLGQTTESVIVTGSAELVESGTAARGKALPPKEIQELPLKGRYVLQLAALTPGLQTVATNEKAIFAATNTAAAHGALQPVFHVRFQQSFPNPCSRHAGLARSDAPTGPTPISLRTRTCRPKTHESHQENQQSGEHASQFIRIGKLPCSNKTAVVHQRGYLAWPTLSQPPGKSDLLETAWEDTLFCKGLKLESGK
jgi:hypothetical protein